LFKRWFFQVLALLIAWTILLGASGLIDELCGMKTHLVLVAWLCTGIAVMLIKQINFPFPGVDRIDVPGAFTMLWWAACWPWYLRAP
jgi:hypothetical protein